MVESIIDYDVYQDLFLPKTFLGRILQPNPEGKYFNFPQVVENPRLAILKTQGLVLTEIQILDDFQDEQSLPMGSENPPFCTNMHEIPSNTNHQRGIPVPGRGNCFLRFHSAWTHVAALGFLSPR